MTHAATSTATMSGMASPNDSSGGGDDPVLKVRMTGPGLHTYDPPGTPTPTVIQGMMYSSGGATLVDANTGMPVNGWTLTNYTWTFPGSAVKGYGTFSLQAERSSNQDDPGYYWIFNAGPDVDASTADYQSFTGDDLNYDSSEVNDHVINSFYWGPGASGNQTVSITATFTNTTTNQTFTDSDSVTFNVIKPLGNMTATLGTAGLSTAGATYDGYQYIGIDNGSTFTTDWFGNVTNTGPSVGMDGKASITSSSLPAGVTGQFAVVQTVTTSESQTYDGAYTVDTQYRHLTLSDGTLPNGPSLDGSFPYSLIGTAPGPPGTNAVVKYNDNPATSTKDFPYFSTPLSLSRSDSFTDTLMFNPGGIWVPVGSLTWQWSASANYNTTTSTWVQAGASQSSTTYVPASGKGDFPVWSHNISEQTTWTMG